MTRSKTTTNDKNHYFSNPLMKTVFQFFLLTSMLVFTSTSLGVQDVSGTLTGPAVTWSGIMHITGGDVTVPVGTTLTIAAGTEIQVQKARKLIVNGVLRVEGTALSPVVFGPEPGAALEPDPASLGLPHVCAGEPCAIHGRRNRIGGFTSDNRPLHDQRDTLAWSLRKLVGANGAVLHVCKCVWPD